MRDNGYGLDALSCLTQLSLVIAGFAFVDDTDIINAGKSVDTTGEDLLIQQQQVVDTWEGSLNATGGALRPDKSYWYMLDYKHSGNQWKYKSIKQLPGEITVKVSDGTRQTLLRLEPNEAKETLGICISMDGNSNDQMEHLLKKKLGIWRKILEHLK